MKGRLCVLAHTIRLEEQDPPKIIAVGETGGRVSSDIRRAGRARTKWYDTTRNHAIKKLVQEGHLPRDVVPRGTKQESNKFPVQIAQDKHI